MSHEIFNWTSGCHPILLDTNIKVSLHIRILLDVPEEL